MKTRRRNHLSPFHFSHKTPLACFHARPTERFRSKMNIWLRLRSNAAPYFVVECFLPILIRYLSVYAVVVLRDFCVTFCDSKNPLLKNRNSPTQPYHSFEQKTYHLKSTSIVAIWAPKEIYDAFIYIICNGIHFVVWIIANSAQSTRAYYAFRVSLFRVLGFRV